MGMLEPAILMADNDVRVFGSIVLFDLLNKAICNRDSIVPNDG
jgi:hypothetical protein